MKLIPQGPKVYFPRFVFTLLRSSQNLEPNKVSFRVPKVMNKYDITQYLEKIYGINVKDIETIIYGRKVRTVGRYQIVQGSWKKAIITLDHEFKYPEPVKDKSTL